ncbi:hypothetical protein [Nocardioides sp. TF02-7]|uniref:dCTP deaminase n=1 Tax=Nocardioides sp. TF02-7 TaxID=2917724 RepID=UPI001F06C7E1|nr:hypothetical protein [Nocardioides sp. TF02-7]UMG94161.1 hypothetical protein MF408_09055 [Nocardioides sp. TF02-7]
MPSDCAGAIEGRSSYARMGLSVHTAGGFINPGWKGHMPLTLYNHSPVTLRLPVGTPVCQLLVIALAEAPGLDYAQREDRKYLNDQGGPSLWWRDAIMKRIRDKFAEVHLDARAFDELDELMADNPDEGVLARLEDFLAKQGGASFGNADDVLRQFAKKEKRHRIGVASALNVGRGGWTVTGGWLLALLQGDNVSAITWAAAILANIAGALGLLWGAFNRVPFYLTPEELNKAQQRRDRQRPTVPPVDPAPDGH